MFIRRLAAELTLTALLSLNACNAGGPNYASATPTVRLSVTETPTAMPLPIHPETPTPVLPTPVMPASAGSEVHLGEFILKSEDSTCSLPCWHGLRTRQSTRADVQHI